MGEGYGGSTAQSEACTRMHTAGATLSENELAGSFASDMLLMAFNVKFEMGCLFLNWNWRGWAITS
jgi:hypothetical protein